MLPHHDNTRLSFDEVLDDTQREIRNYSVGFVYKDKPLGSGTLVQWGDQFGILTAAHVVNRLDFGSTDKLRIPLVGCGHSFGIPCCGLTEVAKFYKYGGPDIAMLKLPPLVLGTLKAVKSFYNLSVHTPKKLQASLGTTGLFLLSGGPAALSQYKPPDHGFSKLVNSPSMRFQGLFKKRYKKNGFDYVEVEADCLRMVGVSCLGGLSGGGLWRVLVSKSKEPDRHHYHGVALSGVVFFEKGMRADGTRRVICQGANTIFKRVLASASSR